VQLHQSAATVSVDELQRRIRRKLGSEKELLVDPLFFSALMREVARITGVQVQLRRGRHPNEMSKFRYDAFLRVESDVPRALIETRLEWRKDRMSLSRLREILAQEEPDRLILTGVPNGRLQQDARLLEVMAGGECPETAGELRKVVSETTDGGVDPEDIWSLTDDLPYTATVGYDHEVGPFGMAVLLERRSHGANHEAAAPLPEGNELPLKECAEYGNDPLHGRFSHVLVPLLRDTLKERLPDYMIPASFVLLPTLPRTAAGKVDYGALPAPDALRPELGAEFVAPRTPIEVIIGRIWQEVLGLDRVGIHDDFFDLGGHSLLATQVISRVREKFKMDVPLQSLFEAPTISSLGEALVKLESVPGQVEATARLRHRIDEMNGDEVRAILEAKRGE
jgi:acyl carrier protein